MDDFNNDAVACFVDCMYTGEVEKLELGNFEDVHKMAHVFEVSWLRKKCAQFYRTDVLNFQNNSYTEILFACEIASRAHNKLKQSKFVSCFVRNMKDRNIGKKAFLRKYMANFAELSKPQIDMSIQIARKDPDILFEFLINYLSFGLKFTGFDENSLYLLQHVDIKRFQRSYPVQFVEFLDLMTELSEGSDSDEVKEVLEKFVNLRNDGVVSGSDEVIDDSGECSNDSGDEDLQECQDIAIQTEQTPTGKFVKMSVYYTYHLPSLIHVSVTCLIHVSVTCLMHVSVTCLIHVSVTCLLHVPVTCLLHVSVTCLLHVSVTCLSHV